MVKVVQKVSLFSPDSSLYYHQPLKHLVEVTSYTRKDEVSTLIFFDHIVWVNYDESDFHSPPNLTQSDL